jgi:hypothetical protein
MYRAQMSFAGIFHTSKAEQKCGKRGFSKLRLKEGNLQVDA